LKDTVAVSNKVETKALARLVSLLLAILWSATAVGSDAPPFRDDKPTVAIQQPVPDSKQLESELQHLPWDKFRLVIESVPKLKADVEAYGPAGWRYVETRYRTYGWKKGIDKLDDNEKRLLADRIKQARTAK